MAGRKQAWADESSSSSARVGGRSGGGGGASKRRREQMKQLRLAKMDGAGWNLSSTDTDIPTYSAETDKYCPWARTPKMRQRIEGSRKRERLERQDRLERGASSTGKLARQRRGDETGGGGNTELFSQSVTGSGRGPGSMVDPGSISATRGDSKNGGGASKMGGTLSTSTSTGGVTFQAAHSTQPEHELEVLKSILLREGYLERLRRMGAAAGSAGLRGECVDLLDLLRVSSVETVDAITRWRGESAYASRPAPFVWNGVNYLLKMPSDLDFLDEVVPLTSWLGFSMLRNPFVMPNSLDQLAEGSSLLPQEGADGELGMLTASNFVDPTVHPALAPPGVLGPGGAPVSSLPPSIHAGTHHDPTTSAIDTDYVGVGGNPVLLPLPPPPGRAPPKGATAAVYDAPVVNDQDLLPEQVSLKKPVNSGVGGGRAGVAKASLPSQVGDLDVLKVRKAEVVIVAEERLYGRFMRDRTGRIMPESLARKANFAATLSQYEDNTRPPSPGNIPSPEKGQGQLSPIKGQPAASVRELERRKGAAGRQRAQKRGGVLAPLSKTAPHEGRKQKPKQLSRGARLENETARARKENERLMGELKAMQEELAEAQYQVGAVAADPLADPADVAEAEGRAAALAARVAEAEAELAKREAEVAAKEEMRDHIKKSQKEALDKRRAAELERKRKQLQEGEVLAEDEEEAVTIEDFSATCIQKIARGRHARAYVAQRRTRFNYAATQIQAGTRGLFDRRRVRLRRQQHYAAIQIQKVARGRRGRSVANRRRHEKLTQFCAAEIQKIYRAMLGRRRMADKRTLVSYSALANEVSLTIFPSQILELCDVCVPSNRRQPPPATVLALVQAVMLFTARRGERYTKLHTDLSWGEAAKFLRRAAKLVRRIRAVSEAASKRLLRVPRAGVNLVKAYAHEPMWSPDEMEKIGPGGVACKKLFEWILSTLKVVSVQDQFVESERDWPEGEEFWPREGEEEQAEDRAEDVMCLAQEAELERQYVPADLLLAYRKRPRPVVLAVARDVPSFSKKHAVDRLMADFPSLFVRINAPEIDVAAVQAVLDLGNSVVLDVDVGIGAAQRRGFLGAFTTMKQALMPTPICLLLKGDDGNRHGSGAEVRLGVSQADMKLMADMPLKMALEEQAESFVPLYDGSLSRLMRGMGTKRDPPSALVLVLEAVIVLLTPQKRFKGPGSSTRAVAWEAGRRLLANPGDLARRLRRFKRNTVPPENVAALQKYMAHEEWPDPARLYGKAEDTPVLSALARWVSSTINYALLLADQGGPGREVSRRFPAGLFASAVTIKDPDTAEDGGFEEGEHTGWRDGYNRTMGPLLEDVRVYRESRKVGGKYLTVNVYRDCNRFFFSAYDAADSVLRYAVIEQKEVNLLLAPNSMEIRGGAFSDPPRSTLEMYQRLIRLCALETHRVKGRRMRPQRSLVCKRDLVCLLQESRRIQGHFVVLSVSERARGEIYVVAYVPKYSARLELHITLPLIRRILPDCDDEERALWESEDAAKMLVPAVDRLCLFHPTKSSPSLGVEDKRNKGQRSYGFKLQLRTKGGAGRLVTRQSQRLGHGRGKKRILMVSLYECGVGGPLRMVVTNPATSEIKVIHISARERIDLVDGCTDYSMPKRLLARLLNKSMGEGESRVHNIVAIDKTTHVHSRKVLSRGHPNGWFLVTVRASVAGPEGGVALLIYNADGSSEWRMELSDDAVADNVRAAAAAGYAPARTWGWPTEKAKMRRAIIEQLASTLFYDEGEDAFSVGSPALAMGRRSDKRGAARDKIAQAERASKERARAAMAAVGGPPGTSGASRITGGGMRAPPGAKFAPKKRTLLDGREELVFDQGCRVRMVGATEPAFVNVKVWHHKFKAFHYRFVVYNPNRCVLAALARTPLHAFAFCVCLRRVLTACPLHFPRFPRAVVPRPRRASLVRTTCAKCSDRARRHCWTARRRQRCWTTSFTRHFRSRRACGTTSWKATTRPILSRSQ